MSKNILYVIVIVIGIFISCGVGISVGQSQNQDKETQNLLSEAANLFEAAADTWDSSESLMEAEHQAYAAWVATIEAEILGLNMLLADLPSDMTPEAEEYFTKAIEYAELSKVRANSAADLYETYQQEANQMASELRRFAATLRAVMKE